MKQAKAVTLWVACVLVAAGAVLGPAAWAQEGVKTASYKRFAEAVNENDIETVKKLRGQGIDGMEGAEEIIAAVQRRDIGAVRRLLDRGVDPDTRMYGGWGDQTGWGETALMVAARLGEVEIARLLLDRGADPALSQTLSGRSAASEAIKSYHAGSGDALEMLVEAGVDLAAPPPGPEIPLDDWWQRHRPGRIARMVASYLHNAATPGRDARQHDPTSAAKKVRYLLDAGLDLNGRAYVDRTPLIQAVAEGRFQGRESQLKVLRELLSHKPELDLQDADGCTALHHAVIEVDEVAAKMLVDAGARKDLEDENGRTPVELAREVYPRADVLEVLGLEASLLPEGGIRAHIHPGRTEGVAPLAVFFDGVGTDGLADDDYVNAYYDWNFDVTGVDPDHPRKTGIGFNTAHVFREPGTYTVRVQVEDTEGKRGEATVEIEVLPFEGKTFYVAADGDDANAGTMERPWQSFGHALGQAAPNTRILFRRGDEFPTGGVSLTDKKGPVVIGAYADPERPSDAAPVISGKSGVSMRGVEDWRFTDLHLKGLTTGRRAKNSGQAFSIWGVRNLLLQNFEIENFGANAVTDPGTRDNSDGIFVADCHMHDFGAYGLYSSRGARIGFLGNRLEQMHSFEHGYRTQGAKKAYVAHNDLRDLGTVKDAITIRGPYSARVVLAHNRFDSLAAFEPANDGGKTFLHHCLAEGNISTCGYWMMGQHLTFRHNRMRYGRVRDRVIRPAEFARLSHKSSQVGVSEHLHFYHNTCYSPAFLVGAGNRVTAQHNIVVLADSDVERDGPRGPFRVARPEELDCDHNLYHAVNTDTGEAVDISEWLKQRRATGHDQNSKAGDPEFLSLDPDSPDFLRPAPGEAFGARVFEASSSPLHGTAILRSRQNYSANRWLTWRPRSGGTPTGSRAPCRSATSPRTTTSARAFSES